MWLFTTSRRVSELVIMVPYCAYSGSLRGHLRPCRRLSLAYSNPCQPMFVTIMLLFNVFQRLDEPLMG